MQHMTQNVALIKYTIFMWNIWYDVHLTEYNGAHIGLLLNIIPILQGSDYGILQSFWT
jgi:hypothetical protein